jgi:hypothetical protein
VAIAFRLPFATDTLSAVSGRPCLMFLISLLMLNEYPQEFVDCIMNASRSNRPSSDTIYQGMVIIPYVKGISEKFRCFGNHFNIRTILKTEHRLHGTLTKTGPVRDAQQMKQYACTVSHVTVADVTLAKQAAL